jgi:hypothetical protein
MMDPIEWCCAYCFFVLGAVEVTCREVKVDFYVEERTRKWLHDNLCKAFGLSRDDMRRVTNNLSEYKFNPHRVYEALCEIKGVQEDAKALDGVPGWEKM